MFLHYYYFCYDKRRAPRRFFFFKGKPEQVRVQKTVRNSSETCLKQPRSASSHRRSIWASYPTTMSIAIATIKIFATTTATTTTTTTLLLARQTDARPSVQQYRCYYIAIATININHKLLLLLQEEQKR